LEQHLGFGSEKRSLKAIRHGRREAYEEIICRHYESVYNLMVYLSGDKSLAEDLTQETFASAWAGIGQFKAKASIKTWLHKIAYNKFIDSKRTSTRRAALLAAQNPILADSDCPPGPAEKSMNDEHTKILYLALDELALCEYVVIVLHYVGGFSFREIGVILDRPVGTVKWQISQALGKLESTLNGRIEQ
jgi:RNA polymerase sigma-70 factor (ECF subfamily)